LSKLSLTVFSPNKKGVAFRADAFVQLHKI
jgi:hypothetical protein